MKLGGRLQRGKELQNAPIVPQPIWPHVDANVQPVQAGKHVFAGEDLIQLCQESGGVMAQFLVIT